MEPFGVGWLFNAFKLAADIFFKYQVSLENPHLELLLRTWRCEAIVTHSNDGWA